MVRNSILFRKLIDDCGWAPWNTLVKYCKTSAANSSLSPSSAPRCAKNFLICCRPEASNLPGSRSLVTWMRLPSRDGTKSKALLLSEPLDVSLLTSLPRLRLCRRESPTRLRRLPPARFASLWEYLLRCQRVWLCHPWLRPHLLWTSQRHGGEESRLGDPVLRPCPESLRLLWRRPCLWRLLVPT